MQSAPVPCPAGSCGATAAHRRAVGKVAAKLAKAVVTKSSGAGVGIITSSLNVRAILTLGHVI